MHPPWTGFPRIPSHRAPGQRPGYPLRVEPLEDRRPLASGISAAMVADIVPGAGSSHPNDLTAEGGTLYFRALHPTDGWALWKSDGTAGGTVMVKADPTFHSLTD